MSTHTAATFNVATATGTVHRMTTGRTWKAYGETFANRHGEARGKADCGAKISSAARVTDSAVTCPKCSA